MANEPELITIALWKFTVDNRHVPHLKNFFCTIRLLDAMYRPDEFRVEDLARMHSLMRVRPFASLVSNGSTGLCASHLPTVLKDEGSCGVIECHLARANPHWKEVASGNEALMIFQGPEGYITPN